MAVQQALVKVFDGERILQTDLKRPIRITPAGFAGVAYAGAVYNLAVDSSINIELDSWEVQDCETFLLVGHPIPFKPSLTNIKESVGFLPFKHSWYLDQNEESRYFLFDAPEKIAVKLVDYLASKDLVIQRWDTSTKLASDNKHYDWFARIDSDLDQNELQEKLGHLLCLESPSEFDTENLVSTDNPERSSTVVQNDDTYRIFLINRIEDLEKEVSTLTRENSRLAAIELDLQQKLVTARKNFTHIQRTLKNLNESNSSTAEIVELRKTLIESESLLEISESINATLQSDLFLSKSLNDSLKQEIADRDKTISELYEHLEMLEEIQVENRRAMRTKIAPQRGTEGFLQICFSRIQFVENSLEILANFESPSNIMRVLTQLDMGESFGKDVHGLDGWREVPKISTGIKGLEDRGRIYYIPHGSSVYVSIHIKRDPREQERHIKRLSNLVLD